MAISAERQQLFLSLASRLDTGDDTAKVLAKLLRDVITEPDPQVSGQYRSFDDEWGPIIGLQDQSKAIAISNDSSIPADVLEAAKELFGLVKFKGMTLDPDPSVPLSSVVDDIDWIARDDPEGVSWIASLAAQEKEVAATTGTGWMGHDIPVKTPRFEDEYREEVEEGGGPQILVRYTTPAGMGTKEERLVVIKPFPTRRPGKGIFSPILDAFDQVTRNLMLTDIVSVTIRGRHPDAHGWKEANIPIAWLKAKVWIHLRPGFYD